MTLTTTATGVVTYHTVTTTTATTMTTCCLRMFRSSITSSSYIGVVVSYIGVAVVVTSIRIDIVIFKVSPQPRLLLPPVSLPLYSNSCYIH